MMNASKIMVPKVALVLSQEYEGTKTYAGMLDRLDRLVCNQAIAKAAKEYLTGIDQISEGEKLSEWFTADEYIQMINVSKQNRGGLYEPDDFGITFQHWFTDRLEVLLKYYDVDLQEKVSVATLERIEELEYSRKMEEGLNSGNH